MTPEPTPQPLPPLPPPAAPQVVPQPLPTQVKVDLVTATQPGQPTLHMLRWDITTPSGTKTIFSDRAFTQQIVQILMGHLQVWPGELVVAQPDMEQVRALLGQPGGPSNGSSKRGSGR
jgi:hypothetical protein